MVKRLVIGASAALMLLVLSMPSFAQGKDPFRPPAGAGPTGAVAGGPVGGTTPGVGVRLPVPGGLPRTGIDLELPVLASAAFIAAGSAMKLSGRALA